MRRRIWLYLARAGTVMALIVSVVVTGVYVESFRSAHVWTRWQWRLTSDTDSVGQTTFTLKRGRLHLQHAQRDEPAFVSPFTGAIAHSSDRTQPTGQRWEHALVSPWDAQAPRGDSPPALRTLGLAWQTPRVTPVFGSYQRSTWWAYANGSWLIALCAAVCAASIAWWRRAGRPLRRMRAGLCAGCGYDLRGSPDRCPECGTTAAV